MPADSHKPVLEAAVAALGHGHGIDAVVPATGGCIHDSFVVRSAGVRLFVKTNSAGFADAFSAEAEGLQALAEAGMRTPYPLATGIAGDSAYLAMEYLELCQEGDWAGFGRALASMHRSTSGRYGWTRDNFIGSTPQQNGWRENWTAFWAEARIGPQLALARANRMSASLLEAGERLLARLPMLLRGHVPAASLLHGDLWRGNAAFTPDARTAVFDPAVYLGDRETDLAMTELFGGFPPSFYAAYGDSYPLDAGYESRRDIYNLYHVLNHANLFGGPYVGRAEAMIRRLLERPAM